MKNYEKYEKEIRIVDGGGCEFKKKHVLGCNCDGLTCKECWNKFLDWLMQEYKQPPRIDWSKVPIDTPVFFNKNGIEYRGYFAGYAGFGEVRVYNGGTTSWSSNSVYCTKASYLHLARPKDIEKYSI